VNQNNARGASEKSCMAGKGRGGLGKLFSGLDMGLYQAGVYSRRVGLSQIGCLVSWNVRRRSLAKRNSSGGGQM